MTHFFFFMRISYVGEIAAVIAVLDFIYWLALRSPNWTFYIWIGFALIFIFDWMMGGVADRGIFGEGF
tara:strand:+ start:359 stop:562 length:204 start_codon:yes stop_codon:yes gene_type:complete